MPEGPEVWILAEALRTKFPLAFARGKHLCADGATFSFGLFGGLALRPDGKLEHIARGDVSGKALPEAALMGLNLGPDWMTAPVPTLAALVDTLRPRKKLLGSLLTDQTVIGGLGVAWASEVCAAAGLRPDVRASEQSLDGLVPALAAVRDSIQATYITYWASVQADSTGDALVAFCTGWFQNLYAVRTMRVYKVGTPVTTNGRVFWV